MSKGSSAHHHKRERGFWISFLLVVVFIRNIAGAIAIWGIRASQDETTTPWLITLLVVFALADVVAAVAMWFWKQWGFYLFLISSAAAGVVGLLMTGIPFIIIGAILPPAVLGYIIRIQNKWDAFD
ncbi:MAG: hypothetical protein BMS9Abin02_1948 [Anaerolineae bacterium]|nr:MAG: hypothetical protein BMS9Abin02_1948 [Anaerolineae bacterium]